MELLGALEAERLTEQKWKQYCWIPCRETKSTENESKVQS